MKSDVSSQVFGDETSLKYSTNRAVEKTKGIIMLYKKKPIQAFFYSSSGGYTEVSENVWNKSFPYFKMEKDEFDNKKINNWSFSIREKKLRIKLKKHYRRIGKLKKIYPLKITKSGRWSKIGIKHSRGVLKLSGNKLRAIIGSQYKFKSLKITYYKYRRGKFYFKGVGSGHGVGLPQWSAKKMGELGYDYKTILKKYYKGINFGKIK